MKSKTFNYYHNDHIMQRRAYIDSRVVAVSAIVKSSTIAFFLSRPHDFIMYKCMNCLSKYRPLVITISFHLEKA